MNVGINGRYWSQPYVGIGQYTRYLWEELQKIDAAATDTMDTKNAKKDVFRIINSDLQGQTLENLSPDQTIIAPVPNFLKNTLKNGETLWWEQIGLPQLVKKLAVGKQMNKLKFDVVHYPYFMAPLMPLPKTTKLVVTIHDIVPFILPEYAASATLKIYYAIAKFAARRADLILTDSEFSRQDILRVFKLPPSQVQTVYLGINNAQYSSEPLPEGGKKALFQRLGMSGDEKLIFYIGGFDKRKNVPMLIQAFGQALPKLRELEERTGSGRWTLGIAGKPLLENSPLYPDVTESIARVNNSEPNRVKMLGKVSEEDKALLFRAAEMFAFPSLYEGFGLGPLEALASGTPTLCSSAASLPEVVGNAAYVIEPNDVQSWSSAIVTLAANPEQRAELAAKGPTRAQDFTWAKTAERTLELYRNLL